jgi:TonB family protein
MNKAVALILGLFLLVPLVWSQGLDEINVSEMSWLFKCYQGVRPGAAAPSGTEAPLYSKPTILNNLGKDENLAKELNLIKTTFNLSDVKFISQGELWLRTKEPMGLFTLKGDTQRPLSVQLERLDGSWLHYRITVYEANMDSKAVMRSAFTIPSSMTLKEAVVFGFENSAHNPIFLSLRITNLYAEGKAPGKTEEKAPAQAGKPAIIPPRLVSQVPPIYPEAAKKMDIEGTVVLSVTLDEKGNVVRARVIKSIPELDQAAIDTVEQWKYEPMTVNGVPKPIVLSVSVEFKR